MGSAWSDISGSSMKDKQQKLILARGLNAKVLRLRVLVRDHFLDGGWDTEQHGKDAAKLCDEIIDMTTVLRNELT